MSRVSTISYGKHCISNFTTLSDTSVNLKTLKQCEHTFYHVHVDLACFFFSSKKAMLDKCTSIDQSINASHAPEYTRNVNCMAFYFFYYQLNR